MGRFGQIAFTPAVKALQERMGSRSIYARGEGASDAADDVVGDNEAAFLAERDSFYMASVGETGWPYVQHRGGPKGFVKVLDEHTLGFADFRGNLQYISAGNVSGDDRVALIFVDYANQARIKILARVSIITAATAPEILARLEDPGYNARVERGFVLRVEGVEWNCPKHISPRFTEDEVRRGVAPLLAKLDALETDNRALRAELARVQAVAASGHK